MRYKHYAPKGDLTIIEGPEDKVADQINTLVAKALQDRKKVGVICTEETRQRYPAGDVKCIGTRSSEETIALHLYQILREFDDDSVEYIYSEAFDTPRMGQAIMNRLLKAAGHKIIKV